MLGVTLIEFLIFAYCSTFNCVPQSPPVIPEVAEGRQDYFPGGIHFSPIVWTLNGRVGGYVMRTIRNRPIAAFEGIPYAKPPIGHLRFRSPVPAASWKGIREAKKVGDSCLQFDYSAFYITHGREDCLYLNVYSTNITPGKGTPAKLLPVMVFIPGGGFLFGTGADYGASYLLDTQDMILITFNYRLGILGFLSTGDDEASGNWGMKDQVLLLRWVQKNIAAFGGDPKRITIAGQSAGSVSVGLHLISPLTRDIPQQAIMQSGHPFAWWAQLNRTVHSSRIVAQAVGCPIYDSKGMVDCLRSLEPNEIVRSQFAAWKELGFPTINFAPVVENPEIKDAFLTESVENSYRNGHVSRAPVLMGLVHDEGEFTVAYVYLNQEFRRINRRTKSLFPYMLEYQDRPLAEQDEITRQITRYYFNNEPISFEAKERLSKAAAGRYFNTPIRRGMEMHSKLASTYGYLFNYTGKHTVLEKLGLNRKDWRISHNDDLAYLFNSTMFFDAFKTTDRDYFMVKFITNVWGNFVAKGKPVYTNSNGEDVEVWSPVKPNSNPGEVPEVLEINKQSKMIEYPYEDEYDFWRNLELI